jgi:CheY-like chemotaxis protein
MGGRIGFTSRPGCGSTFWFTAALEGQSGPATPAEAPNPFGGLRVLVVQAEPAGRTILSRYLQSWGCRTAEAARSEEAIAQLLDAARQGDPFRAALIDLQMRDRSALGLAQAVKLEPAIRNTELMAVLPPALSPESIRLRENGFAAHVPKPIRPSRLYGGLLELFRPALVEELPPEQPGAERTRRVLLAEDNEINRKIVSRLLEKNGCRTDLAGNGKEAVEAAAARRYDLILMDVQMPELDGFAATEQIRRLEGGIRHTPIAAMTANAMTGDREKCLAAGMDDYISKPVRLRDLERTLERWLG